MTPLPPKRKPGSRPSDKVTLQTIAEHLGLTAGTVSAALNNSAASRSIPEHTKKRIVAAARELNYRPNFFARTLRLKRTYTIGVIAEEIGDAYGAMVISGIEEYLRKNNYFFLTVLHRHDPKLLQTYAQMLLTRGVEGFITTDASLKETLTLPTVAVAGHARVEGVTNVVLDHKRAAQAGTGTSEGAGTRGHRIHQGPDSEFGFRGAMERDLRGSARDAHSGAARIDDPIGRDGFDTERRIPIRETTASAKASLHGAVCLQRYFRDRFDLGD